MAESYQGSRKSIRSVAAVKFLDSIGVGTHMGHGVDDPQRSAAAIRYGGFRNVREGDNASPEFTETLIALHRETGVRFVIARSGPDEAWMSEQLRASARLAEAGALLALEGPNEPNNWAVRFGDRKSDAERDFLPVAQWQRELYRRAKADPVLRSYPVFHSSEAGGAAPNNVGLQFLTIPAGAGTLMPDGTAYADCANVHNYICRKPGIIDNMAWLNASPDRVDWVDGLYAEYGATWRSQFAGYTDPGARAALPRVATETGWPSVTPETRGITEEEQGRLYLNMYMSQFARGFTHTFMYMLRDDPPRGEPGYGMFRADYTPKKSATYLHNLTAILADVRPSSPGALPYLIADQPGTVHDLLLRKSDGQYFLVVWNERVKGADDVSLDLGDTHEVLRVYDPTLGTSPISTLRQVCRSRLVLSLSDHPVVVEIGAARAA